MGVPAPRARPPVGGGASRLPLPVWEQIERLAISDDEKAALPYRRTTGLGLGRRRLVDVVRRRGGLERAQAYLQRVTDHVGTSELAFVSPTREPLRPRPLGLQASAELQRSESTIAVATRVEAEFGGRRYRFVYDAPASGLSVDTVSSWSHPSGNVVATSTVDLHETTSPRRIELALVARSRDGFTESALALAALRLMTGEHIDDGVVTDDALGDFYLSTTTPHLLWSRRTPWPGLSPFEVAGVGSVSWLFGWPITESERAAVADVGGVEVAECLRQAGADPTDLWRSSPLD